MGMVSARDDSRPSPTYIGVVAKAKSVAWEIIKIGAKGVTLGIVYAPDKESARKLAVEQYKIRPAYERWLIIRKV